jgi:hypothetical protein
MTNHHLLKATPKKISRKMSRNSIISKKTDKSRKSGKSIGSQSRVGSKNRKGSIITVTNAITLPKNMFSSGGITKDNKSHWEAASRKLRALVPVMINLNNERALKDHTKKEKERRRSLKSWYSNASKSSKSDDGMSENRGRSPNVKRTKKLNAKPPARRRTSVFQLLPGLTKKFEISKALPNPDISPKKSPRNSVRHPKRKKSSNQQLLLTPKHAIANIPKELHIEFHPDADKEHSVEVSETEYNESSIFNTSEIEEDIIHQGALSIVSQFNVTRSKWVFGPDSNYKISWDVFNFVLIIYQSLVVPYRI